MVTIFLNNGMQIECEARDVAKLNLSALSEEKTENTVSAYAEKNLLNLGDFGPQMIDAFFLGITPHAKRLLFHVATTDIAYTTELFTERLHFSPEIVRGSLVSISRRVKKVFGTDKQILKKDKAGVYLMHQRSLAIVCEYALNHWK